MDKICHGHVLICPIGVCVNYISQLFAIVCRLDSLSNRTRNFTLDRQRVPLGTLLSSPPEDREETKRGNRKYCDADCRKVAAILRPALDAKAQGKGER